MLPITQTRIKDFSQWSVLKVSLPTLWILLLVPVLMLVSCGDDRQGGRVEFEMSDEALVDAAMISFAQEHILKAAKSDLSVSWELEEELGEQAFILEVDGPKIRVRGGDLHGLMYGGLEIAEQLDMTGRVIDTEREPFIRKRGLKMNIPLDARTPSYDDSGDSAIRNVKTVWEWDFWETYLDRMALNRYNVLSLWNPHPFPSMVKLDSFPDVALEDVYTTSYRPTGVENEMGDPQLVSSVVFDNLELVRELSIEEKIAFWTRVMDHARDRGIDIYWITWNICPNSVATPVEPGYKTYGINMKDERPGKHGITHQMDNPITAKYHRAAVRQLLLTYPQIKGIGVTAGEHMPLDWKGKNREEWLWETYGQGILEAKELQPDREVEFIHRVWHSDMEQIMNYWQHYPDPFDVSFKYAKARLYSSPSINFYSEHVDQMRQHNLKSWWNLRNDDIFVFRWADVNYVREFLANLPHEDTRGYYMGSDGYVWGREFVSTDEALRGELEIDKHRMRFMLWGRLGYDNELDEKVFLHAFKDGYEMKPSVREDQMDEIFTTWQLASKIIPQVNRFHWRNWDADWSVEACRARHRLGGFRNVFDFVDNPVMEGQNLINCRDHAVKTLSGEEVAQDSPTEVAERLLSWGNEAVVRSQSYSGMVEGPNSTVLLQDIQAMGYLGLYYGHKISAASHLAFFDQTRNLNYKSLALADMGKALEAAKNYARIARANYRPQMLARPGPLDWDALVTNVIGEMQALEAY